MAKKKQEEVVQDVVQNEPNETMYTYGLKDKTESGHPYFPRIDTRHALVSDEQYRTRMRVVHSTVIRVENKDGDYVEYPVQDQHDIPVELGEGLNRKIAEGMAESYRMFISKVYLHQVLLDTSESEVSTYQEPEKTRLEAMLPQNQQQN